MTSRLDVITGRMSKLMLKRWPMLADMCSVDGCSSPLMRDPATGEAKCVWHDAKELFPDELTEAEIDDTSANAEPANDTICKTDEKMSMDTKNPTALFDDKDDEEKVRLRREKREQGDRASQLIAKRLLQGWKLLDQPCPNSECHNVPLVQDRDGMRFCVICEQRYMDEADYVKRYGSLDQKQPSAEPTRNTLAIQEPDKTVGEKRQPTSTSTSSGGGSVATPAVQEAIDTLNAKIAELSARLLVATHPKDIVRITKAISSCAKAICKCQKLVV